MTDSYLEFYGGKPNPNGLKLHNVWKFTDHEYESYHDFIQWVFPSDEPSMILSNAPVVTKRDAMEFRFNEAAQLKLRHSYRQFLRFLGICLDLQGNPYVADEKKFHQRVCRQNHNLQRITRVLRSLMILGMPNHARKFESFLVDANHRYGLNPISMQYWSDAVK